MSDISDQLLEELQEELEGTCTSLTGLIERHGLDVSEDDLEDRLLDGAHAVERCGGCEWWFRCGDLEFDEEKNAGFCASCEEDLC